MATDVNVLLNKVKKLQKSLEQKLDQSALVRDLKKYAATQQKVLKKRIDSSSDLKRAIGYIEKRRKELDKVTKNLPKEVATIKKFVAAQRKEFEKVGKQLIKELAAGDLKAVKNTAKKYTGTMKRVGKVKIAKAARRGGKSANA